MVRWLKPIGCVAMTVVFIAICGWVYEELAERRDRARFPQVGHSVDIGGRSLNIFCSGSGQPTVVFDSGRGMPGYSWLLVQPGVAKATRACWYDRAGYGWSDPAPSPHRSDAIANDLHQLLQAAGIDPPYVLVGHSFGGLNVRMFYEFYPADVAGMVLVDPSDEDFETVPHPNLGAPMLPLPKSLFPAALFMARVLGPLGIFRLLASSPAAPPTGVTRDEWAELARLEWQYKAQVARIQEGPEAADFELLRRAGSLRSLPLVILIAGRPPLASESADMKAFELTRIQLLEKLARKSTRGRKVVVANSGHDVPYEAPASVIDAVREIVVEVRQGNRG